MEQGAPWGFLISTICYDFSFLTVQINIRTHNNASLSTPGDSELWHMYQIHASCLVLYSPKVNSNFCIVKNWKTEEDVSRAKLPMMLCTMGLAGWVWLWETEWDLWKVARTRENVETSPYFSHKGGSEWLLPCPGGMTLVQKMESFLWTGTLSFKTEKKNVNKATFFQLLEGTTWKRGK